MSQQKGWTELNAKVPKNLAEAVSLFLFEMGANGVQELETTPDTDNLVAYFETPVSPQDMAYVSQYFSQLSETHQAQQIEWFTQTSQPVDWVSEYRKQVKPQKLSRHFFLRPPWAHPSVVPPEMTAIVMEPGQAFGTGLHPTTQLCLKLLERVAGYEELNSALDIGTGSGILAIAAKHLGIDQVVGIDNDPICIPIAQENAEQNGFRELEFHCCETQEMHNTFDLVISNILYDVHLHLIAEYQRLLNTKGFLLLSGVLVEQMPPLFQVMKKQGFVLEIQHCLQSWGAMLFVKGDPRRTVSNG